MDKAHEKARQSLDSPRAGDDKAQGVHACVCPVYVPMCVLVCACDAMRGCLDGGSGMERATGQTRIC